MNETTPDYHRLSYALATARELLQDLPNHQIRDELDELKLKSYILLQHAAIEEYLEQVSVFALRECKNAYIAESVIGEPLVAVCAHYNVKALDHYSSTTNTFKASDIFVVLFERAINAHVTALAGIHGIKTKDQDAILNPLGIRIHDFDHLLSQRLNSLGELRGQMAHRFGMRVVAPKIAVLKDTEMMLQLLLAFDNEICRKVKTSYQAI